MKKERKEKQKYKTAVEFLKTAKINLRELLILSMRVRTIWLLVPRHNIPHSLTPQTVMLGSFLVVFLILILTKIILQNILLCFGFAFFQSQIPAKNYIWYCVKSVRIRSYSGPYFPAFGLNTERYSVSLRTQSEWRKIWIRVTPNTDNCYTVQP